MENNIAYKKFCDAMRSCSDSIERTGELLSQLKFNGREFIHKSKYHK